MTARMKAATAGEKRRPGMLTTATSRVTTGSTSGRVCKPGRIGENSGMMNIGIPSIVIKMLRSKFDQQWSIRKSESTEKEQAQVLRLVSTSQMQLDGRLDGPTIRVEDLMDIQDDDVLMFDYPVGRLVDLTVNGKLKYRGRMVATGRKRAFEIEEMHKAS